MPDIGGIAGEQLRQYVELIERLEEEKAAIAGDIKEVFAEAKAAGFDTKVMRAAIKHRKADPATRDEQAALLAVYLQALGDYASTPLGQAAVDRVAA